MANESGAWERMAFEVGPKVSEASSYNRIYYNPVVKLLYVNVQLKTEERIAANDDALITLALHPAGTVTRTMGLAFGGAASGTDYPSRPILNNIMANGDVLSASSVAAGRRIWLNAVITTSDWGGDFFTTPSGSQTRS